MWRVLVQATTLFVFGVTAGMFLPASTFTVSTESQDVIGQVQQAYPYLSAITTTNVPVTPMTVGVSESEINARFTGMLLHLKWLLKEGNQGGVSKELFDKQVDAILDNINDSNDGGGGSGLPSSFVVDNSGNVTSGAWQGTVIADAYIADTLTLGASSVLADDLVTPDVILAAAQTDEYCLTYEATGDTWEWQTCGTGGSGLATTSIDTSAELRTIVSDETGTGALVFAGSPTLTGTLSAAAANFSGNVGIGTTTPSQALTVQGNVNLSSATGAIYFDDAKFIYASSTNHGILFGELAGESIGTTDLYNIALGYQAGRVADSNYNIFAGAYAGYNSSGQHNYLFGYNAGYNNNGAANFIAGPDAGYNNFGGNNFIIGDDAGYNNTGTENFIYGTNAGYGNSGSSNFILGASAGYSSTGSNNLIIGEEAGYNNGGNGNILLGYKVANNLTSGSHNIVIGYDIDSANATSSNTLNIGNLIFGTGLDGTGTSLSSGNIGIGSTSPSSKLTIQNTGLGNSFIVEDQASDTTPFVIDASGNVGIGDVSPDYLLDIEQTSSITSGSVISTASGVTANPGSNSTGFYQSGEFYASTNSGLAFNVGTLWGSHNAAYHGGSGIVTEATGLYVETENYGNGTITNSNAITAYLYNEDTITNQKFLNVNDIVNSGTITNTYGLYLGDLTAGTQTNQAYSIYASDAGTRNYFAGNVGIGTSTPTGKLEVVDNQNGWSSISIANNNTGASAVTAIDFLPADGNGVSMYVGSDASYARAFAIESGAPDGIDLAAVEPTGILTFKTGGTNERMRVTSAGNVGIGTTTPAQKLQVYGNIRVGTAGGNGCLEDFAGTLIAGTCSSDEELKKDIVPIATEERSYLEALAALTPVTYTWNETAGELYSKDTNFENLGLIAQDVEEQFPELISYNSEGYRQVNFSAFPFYIIEALKEVWQKIKRHDERIEKLEEENAALKSRLNEIESELDINAPPAPAPAPEEPPTEGGGEDTPPPTEEPPALLETPSDPPSEPVP